MQKRIRKRQIEAWEKAARRFAAVLHKIQETCPEANVYLQEDTLHLMVGPSHDDNGRALQGNSVAAVPAYGHGGGAW